MHYAIIDLATGRIRNRILWDGSGDWHPEPGQAAIPDPPPSVGPGAEPIWNGTAWIVAVDPAWSARALAQAWTAADACARAGMDENSRLSILGLMLDPACPAWRLARIGDFRTWWTALWDHYGAVRAAILAGQNAAFDPAAVGPCPWSIWQIAGDAP